MEEPNAFDADAALAESLERLLPPELRDGLAGECRALAAQQPALRRAARRAESEPPRRAGDGIAVSDAWSELLAAAARWGLAAIPGEQRLGPWARLHQVSLLQLYAPVSAGAWQLAAQSDAVAATLLRSDPVLAARAVPGLTSRDPTAWRSGAVWLTEHETVPPLIAVRAGERFALSGRQWPAPGAAPAAALTLARSDDARAEDSLYFLPEPGRSARLLRLDERWTVRALPVAELSLEAAPAERVGEAGAGRRTLEAGVQVMRLHAAAAACGIVGRFLERLRRGDTPLETPPLRRGLLASLQVEHEAAVALVIECARVLGRDEQGEATAPERAWLPLLAPLARLATTRQALAVAADVSESLGAAAFAEESGVPELQRAAQALTLLGESGDALSLELLRQTRQEDRLETVLEGLRGRIHRLAQGSLADLAEPLAGHLESFAGGYRRTLAAGAYASVAGARRLALGFAALAAAIPLAEQAAWAARADDTARSAAAVRRWIATRIPRLPDPALSEERLDEDARLGGGSRERTGRSRTDGNDTQPPRD